MLKKLLLVICLAFASTTMISQETGFGLTAGYLNLNVRASYEGVNASTNGSGFYVGALADIPLSESFYLQPSVIYGNAEDSNILYFAAMGKYYVAGSGFNIQAGPQLSLILDEVGGDINTLGIDLGIGAGYDITENFFLQGRYAFEVTNRIDGKAEGVPEGVKSTINSLMIGVGYKF